MEITEGSALDYVAMCDHYNRAGESGYTVAMRDSTRSYSIVPSAYNDPQSGFFHVGKNFESGSPEKETGWKLHVSIAHEYLAEGYARVAEILMDAGVIEFKVAGPQNAEKLNNPDAVQSGKMITIYDHEGGPDLVPVMEKIERALDSLAADGKTVAGPEVKNDRRIGGSNYIFYRNELDQDGRYISNRELEHRKEGLGKGAYNLSGKPDPWEHVVVVGTKEPATALAKPSLTVSEQEIKTAELQEALQSRLPPDSILGVRYENGAYHVSVPSTFSAEGLQQTGLSGNFERRVASDYNHVLVIPETALNPYYHITPTSEPENCPTTQALNVGKTLRVRLDAPVAEDAKAAILPPTSRSIPRGGR